MNNNHSQLTTSSHTNRDAYVFQIGFDFGTSYSKCIIRELTKDQAFVFTFDHNGRAEYLISSTIIYQNNRFRINSENVQYPENGIWHIKMALVDIAHNNFTSPTLSQYNKSAGLIPGSPEQKKFVKSACLFYLAKTFGRIHEEIYRRFPDFGTHEGDDIFINMAIPVRDFEDKKTIDLFEELLEKSWSAVENNKNFSEQPTLEEMNLLLGQVITSKDKCRVYPEVSSNIQAFIKSPMFAGKSSDIYLVSDTGSGTVDQCCFTFYDPDLYEDTINYLSAQVFKLGSGRIELKCAEKFGGDIDKWRYFKEENINDKLSKINFIKNDILGDLRQSIVKYTIPQLYNHLYKGRNVDPTSTIKRKLYIIFSGGGDVDMPYHQAVIHALQYKFGSPINDSSNRKEDWVDNRIIPIIDIPTNLEIPGNRKDWMKRLFVAYGLSFGALPKYMLPKETEIITETRTERRVCPYCRGQNPMCLHCDGYGYV